MSEGVGKQLGSFTVMFLKYDINDNSGFWRSYTCIYVAVDVRNPLKCSMKIRKSDGVCFIASFKYEKLGSFCFFYGCLGHIGKFGDKLSSVTNDEGNRVWGPWLRAQDRRTASLG